MKITGCTFDINLRLQEDSGTSPAKDNNLCNAFWNFRFQTLTSSFEALQYGPEVIPRASQLLLFQ